MVARRLDDDVAGDDAVERHAFARPSERTADAEGRAAATWSGCEVDPYRPSSSSMQVRDKHADRGACKRSHDDVRREVRPGSNTLVANEAREQRAAC
jgi:hypothetical protein